MSSEPAIKTDASTAAAAPAAAAPVAAAGAKAPRMDMKKWNEMFNQLLDFKKDKGHCRPPAHHSKLGNWVMFMRRYYALGKLNQEQIDRLEEVGFQWRLQTHSKPRNPRVTEVADAKFKEMVNKLTAYKEQHGNCAVPVKYEEDPALGFWVKKQRNLKSSGKMREDREKMLNELGFQWSGRRQSGGLEAVPASGDAAVKGEKVLEVAQAAAEHAREQEMRGAEV